MSHEEPDAIERAALDDDKLSTARWVRRGVVILAAIAAAFILYQLAASFMPRWWAQRVADQANGKFASGTSWGLFYGFVFTAVPLLIFFQVRRKFLNWKAKLVVTLLAVALAAPNWLTLAVVVANSNAAHAGERIFDVDAPGFRWATLIGAITGAVMAVLMSGTSIAMSRKRRQVKTLKQKVKDNEREREEAARAREEEA